VLVNNAGYGHEGILEESTLAELRQQFEVNVFGSGRADQGRAAAHARAPRPILNITSMGGFITMPGIAWYCGSKFALEGISEVLGKEVAPFGIHVTAVAPGSSAPTGQAARWCGHRAALTTTTHCSIPSAAREAKSGHQPGDP
jgi:short-subunit dehydrogenase